MARCAHCDELITLDDLRMPVEDGWAHAECAQTHRAAVARLALQDEGQLKMEDDSAR